MLPIAVKSSTKYFEKNSVPQAETYGLSLIINALGARRLLKNFLHPHRSSG
jgi:hypothetical protein